MAMNRPTTRRRSQRQAFEEEDAPVAKRPKTEAGGAAKKANGAARQAAKAAYDENDGGFQFTRRTSRRTTKVQPVPETIPEEPTKPAPAPARRKKNSLAVQEVEAAEPNKRRRSARISGDKGDLQSKSLPKATKKAAPAAKPKKKRELTPVQGSAEKSAHTGVQTPKQPQPSARKRDGGATKIMLPFADTPVITRNKEMRKGGKDGHRRSSTGLRGRRASSLIDSGLSNALPHAEVEVPDFYKYIEQSLPEPRRMKQLLTWCGTRALPGKPSGSVKDANAIMAARAIQQELLDDLANKPELSDWFSREDSVPTAVVKKPNPINVRNQATLQDLEEEVKRLEEEKTAWEAIASASQIVAPASSSSTSLPAMSEIDESLLDTSQASILAALRLQTQPVEPRPLSSAFTFTTPAALETHLCNLSLSLEPNIDLFADGLHKIEQYTNTANRVADRVLGTAAQRLEERERESKRQVQSEGIGVGDVLRGLAGVLNE